MKTYRNQNNWKKKYEDLQEMFQEMSDYLQEVVTQQQSQAESLEQILLRLFCYTDDSDTNRNFQIEILIEKMTKEKLLLKLG